MEQSWKPAAREVDRIYTRSPLLSRQDVVHLLVAVSTTNKCVIVNKGKKWKEKSWRSNIYSNTTYQNQQAIAGFVDISAYIKKSEQN